MAMLATPASNAKSALKDTCTKYASDGRARGLAQTARDSRREDTSKSKIYTLSSHLHTRYPAPSRMETQEKCTAVESIRESARKFIEIIFFALNLTRSLARDILVHVGDLFVRAFARRPTVSCETSVSAK